MKISNLLVIMKSSTKQIIWQNDAISSYVIKVDMNLQDALENCSSSEKLQEFWHFIGTSI